MIEAIRSRVRSANWPGCWTAAGLLALWEASIRSGLVVFEYLPAPVSIATAFYRLARDGPMGIDLAHTLTSVALGWSSAMVLGIVLGTMLALRAGMRRWSLASIEVLRPLPAIAFVPVALIAFGFSLQMEVAVMILPCLWPVLVNTMTAVLNVPARLAEVAQTCHLRPLKAIYKVYLPQAVPVIVVGCRLSLTLALVLAVVAEMIGNPQGLGYALVREQQALQPDRMFAYLILIGLVGIALNEILLVFARLAFPGWRHVFERS